MRKHLQECMLKKMVDCRIMAILILALFSLQTYAAKANSDVQNVKISINLKKASLPAALSAIEKESGYHVLYNNTQSGVVNNITVRCIDKAVSDVLDEIFVGTELTYSFDKNVIIISNKLPQPQTKAKVIVVKGKIIENGTNNPVPGATVLVRNTTKGAITDDKGMFSVSANVGDVLTVSYVGLKDTNYKVVDTAKDVIISMEKSSVEIEEVIVTGYQEISKTRMTGAVETITSKDIANKGFTSVSDIIKGQMPGVTTMNVSGRPGASAEIRIRGINSLTGSSDPIWIVDGMPLQGDVPSISMGGTEFQESVLTNGIGNISPDDIESITVLKDAAATAIYGSRAANGVIVIKTKRGSVGKSSIRVSSSYGITATPKNRLKMMNSTQKVAYERSVYEDFPGIALKGRAFNLLKDADYGLITKQQAETAISRLSEINTDWFDEIFNPGHSQNHSVTLSGGDEKTQYYSSISYLGQKGIIPNNYYESVGANLKITHDFNKRLRIHFDMRSSLRNDRSTGSSINPLEYATFANPYERPYDDNGNYEYDRSYSSDLSLIRNGYKYDVNALKDLNENTSKSKYMSNQMALKLEIKIFNGLMLTSLGSISNTKNTTERILVPESYASKRSSWLTSFYADSEIYDEFNLGKISESLSRSESWTIRNQLEYARGFKGESHYVNAVLGQEVSSSQKRGFSSMLPEWDPTYGLASFPDLVGIGMTASSMGRIAELSGHSEDQDRSVSFYFSGSYSYKDRYVVSGSARLDGADIVGTKNRFHPLWNISGKWNIHKEEFMRGVRFINQLAMRASYGFTGSIDRNVLSFSTLARNTTSFYGNAIYDGEKVMNMYTPAQPSVKWQRKEDRSFGLDVSMLNNRVNVVANYYNNDIRNLIGDNYVATSSGYVSLKANLASINNKGYELSLKTVNVRTKDFSWVTSFNLSHNTNKVTDTFYKDLNDLGSSTIMNEAFLNIYVQNYSRNARFGYEFAGIDPTTGQTLAYVDGFNSKGERLGVPNSEGRYVYNMDVVGNPSGAGMPSTYAKSARKYLGEGEPPLTGGFSTQFNYKRVSLSASFAFYTGHLIRSYRTMFNSNTAYLASSNALVDELNRWRKPGDVTSIAKYTTSNSARATYVYDTNFEKGDFLKCTNVSLGYNLPQSLCSKLMLSNLRFNFNVSNLFTLTNYRGVDPETKGAFGYPSSVDYKFSIAIGF